jgi:hypothetical protein
VPLVAIDARRRDRPLGAALALGRENVAAAGLDERVELRQIGAEALEDAAAYDLAWVPTFFIPRTVLEQVIGRVHEALRPGAWAMLGVYARPDDPFLDALGQLRTVRHGGSLLAPPEVAALLERAGFVDVDVLFHPDWKPPLVFVVGRRSAELLS